MWGRKFYSKCRFDERQRFNWAQEERKKERKKDEENLIDSIWSVTMAQIESTKYTLPAHLKKQSRPNR